MNVIRGFCKILILERQISTGDSRKNKDSLPKSVNFFLKDDLNGENYTTKSCITKKYVHADLQKL